MGDATPERWLPVPGYEGYYEVSDLGRVRSLARPADGRWPARRERILRGHPDRYPGVNLWVHGTCEDVTIHRTVMLAFRGPCPPGKEVRHDDGDPTNNRLSNLIYGTHSENEYDKQRHGTDHEVNKTHCPQKHKYTPENTYVLPSRPNARYCKECQRTKTRERMRRHAQRRREEAERAG